MEIMIEGTAASTDPCNF